MIRYRANSVDVTDPDRYWVATRAERAPSIDPDIDDGHQRHDDRDEIRWDVLGGLLTEVSAALASGQYVASQLYNNAVTIQVSPVPGGLTDGEIEVMNSWFDRTEAPSADPWSDVVTNGRHRLWNVWKHDPEAKLPVRSVVLNAAAGIEFEDPATAEIIRTDATIGLTKLSPSVVTRAPLFAPALARVSAWRPAGDRA